MQKSYTPQAQHIETDGGAVLSALRCQPRVFTSALSITGEILLIDETVTTVLKETPPASSLVENLNSRLRNYFSC